MVLEEICQMQYLAGTQEFYSVDQLGLVNYFQNNPMHCCDSPKVYSEVLDCFLNTAQGTQFFSHTSLCICVLYVIVCTHYAQIITNHVACMHACSD